MIRFAEFEAKGPAVAGITEAKDGDFSLSSLQSGAEQLGSLLRCSVASIQLVSQVHGNKIVKATDADSGPRVLGQADGMVTNRHGIALVVRVADCVPVYLFEPRKHCGALVHAGREGTRTGISSRAVDEMVEDFDADPTSTIALIGPSAGPCCYEVDQETALVCADSGMRVSGRMIDLWESNKDQLARSGLLRTNIEILRVCTICGNAFHSYRRSGTSERNIAMLML